MVCGTDVLFNVGFFANEFGDLGSESGVPVGDDLVGDPIMWEYVCKIEFCQFLGSHCFLARIAQHCFRAIMVSDRED